MNILTKIVQFLSNTGHQIEDVLSPFEHQMLQELHPFLQQVETVGGQVVVDVVKTALSTAAAGLESGGNAGAIISAAATSAISALKAEGEPAVKNAVYGLLAIGMASLPTSAPAVQPPAA